MEKRYIRKRPNGDAPAFKKPDVKAELQRLQRNLGFNFPGALEPWAEGAPWAKPLAVGFKQEARQILSPVQMKALQPVLHFLIASKVYQRALTTEGAMRVNFDGKEVEAVKPEHQLAARVALLTSQLKALSRQVSPEGAVREKLWLPQKEVAAIKAGLKAKHLADMSNAVDK